MITDVLVYLICFSIFVVLQSLAINGIYECFKGSKLVDGISGKVDYQGMIFYMIAPEFFERNKFKFWAKTYTCIKCMAGWAGTISFWLVVLPIFGFHWIEVTVNILDVCILISLNWFVYKRL